MTRTLTRRASLLVNAATAAAVAAAAETAGSAPAEAGGKDVAKGAALVALLAIGAGLIQQQNARAAEQQVTRALPPAPVPVAPPAPVYYQPAPLPVVSPRPVANPAWQQPAPQQTGWQQPGWGQDPAPRGSTTPGIPAVCAVEIGGAQPTTIYADSCLAREGFTYALPQTCAQTIRSQDWSGRVYDGACLRDAGFRTDRRW